MSVNGESSFLFSGTQGWDTGIESIVSGPLDPSKVSAENAGTLSYSLFLL
jgi:hypothetical protein